MKFQGEFPDSVLDLAGGEFDQLIDGGLMIECDRFVKFGVELFIVMRVGWGCFDEVLHIFNYDVEIFDNTFTVFIFLF